MLLAPLITPALFLFPCAFTLNIETLTEKLEPQATNATVLAASTTSNSTSHGALGATQISCDGIHFGSDLTVAGCLGAVEKIDTGSPLFDVEKTWGRRGIGQFGVDLPQRYMSRK